MVLESKDVKLRPYRHSDIPLIYEAVSESKEDGLPWIPWMTSNYTEEDAEAFVQYAQQSWNNGDEYNFAITDSNMGTFLGGCGINQLNRVHHFGNLGYWVRSSKTGRGVATMAARLTAWFAFEELKLSRVEFIIQPENKGSIRVAEKVGAQKEGLLRNRVDIRGSIKDALVFSLIPRDVN